ncbi:hypothetical protein ACFYOY_03160 [Streptomyces sp. NPDC007875]|uniref:hypothetical protein n=1 Tax=Streptomyces sp. NPDC007875 TaxID=3364783 RepID=UPI0036D142E1
MAASASKDAGAFDLWACALTRHAYVGVYEGRYREAAGAVYEQVRQFLELSGGHSSRLTREQKGRLVATCWIAQMYRHFEDPKPGYVADWADLPDWQQETDADIFERSRRV